MRLQTVVPYALKFRGRALLLLAVSTLLLSITLIWLRTAGVASRKAAAATAAATQAVTAKLEANGCQVRVFAVSRASVPFAEYAPPFLKSSLIKTEFGYVAELRAAQLTDENIELLNSYPEVDVVVLGSATPDASLLKLSTLTNLDELRIETTAATRAELAALQLARPDFRIDLCDAQGRKQSRFELPRQFKWNSPELLATDRLLRASGCTVQLESTMRSTLPDIVIANVPQPVSQAFLHQEWGCTIKVNGKHFTPANVALMDRYPQLCVELQGPGVSDDDLEAVAQVVPLKVLWVNQAGTTDDGLNRFHLKRPDVTIGIGTSQNPIRIFEPTVASTAKPAASSVK